MSSTETGSKVHPGTYILNSFPFFGPVGTSLSASSRLVEVVPGHPAAHCSPRTPSGLRGGHGAPIARSLRPIGEQRRFRAWLAPVIRRPLTDHGGAFRNGDFHTNGIVSTYDCHPNHRYSRDCLWVSVSLQFSFRRTGRDRDRRIPEVVARRSQPG